MGLGCIGFIGFIGFLGFLGFIGFIGFRAFCLPPSLKPVIPPKWPRAKPAQRVSTVASFAPILCFEELMPNGANSWLTAVMTVKGVKAWFANLVFQQKCWNLELAL